tara:strand:+ start:32 stop:592 length:561 start_codon:yes stop_codon:yes gene_type:complete
MPIVINGSGSVTGITTRLADAAGPEGSILQVIQTQKTDTGSSAAATFTNLTGMTVTITPTAASSKILISSVLSGNGSAATYCHYFRYYRSISGGAATAIGVGDAASNRQQASWVQHTYPDGTLKCDTISNKWLDSPNTTSAITYTIQHRRSGSNAGTFYYGRNKDDGDSDTVGRFPSTLTVMEIAG